MERTEAAPFQLVDFVNLKIKLEQREKFEIGETMDVRVLTEKNNGV